MTDPKGETDLPWKKFLLLAGMIVIVRILTLPFLDINIGPDEAQYWWWAKHPAFGYYSKPPMIAWLIGATTLFSDAEWAVRLSSPLIHGGTACLIFATAGRLYGARTALWSGLAWLTLPAVTLSSALVSTDMPLLFFWSLSLFAFVRLAESDGKDWPMAILLGVALGFGFMSKYAILYFLVGLVLAFILSPFARRALRLTPLLLSGGVALILLLPNIAWNIGHDFQTLTHTIDNANLAAKKYNFDELSDFFFGQFGVAGPIIFGLLLWGLVTLRKRLRRADSDRGKDLMLLCFALPVLIFYTIMAFITRAHANWAVSALPATLILVSVWGVRAQKTLALKLSFGLHGVIAILFLVFATNFALIDQIGRANDIKRVRGWPAQAAQIAEMTKDYPALLVDDRELMGSLLYYLRDLNKPIMAWDLNRHVDNHYEAFYAYDPERFPVVALVMKYPRSINQYIEFNTLLPIGTSRMDLGIDCPRIVELYEARDYQEKDLTLLPPPVANAGRRDDGCKPY